MKEKGTWLLEGDINHWSINGITFSCKDPKKEIKQRPRWHGRWTLKGALKVWFRAGKGTFGDMME
jgi:hypothetical protein